MICMSRQTLATIVFPAVIIAAKFVALLTLKDTLPAEVATHWGIGGEPDGFTANSRLPWMSAGLTTAVAIPLGLFIARTKPSIIAPRGLTALPAGLATFIAAIVLAATIPQSDLSDEAVRTFTTPWWIIPVAVAAALLAMGVASIIAGTPATPPNSSAPAEPEARRYPLDDSEIAVWSGETAKGRVLEGLAVAMFIGFGISAAMTNWWMLIPATLLAIMMLATARFSVTAGPAGLRVAGPLGYPKISVPLDQIDSANAGEAKAMQFGGWGLRKSLKGNDAVLTRSGPALIVTRTDGAKLHVSLDNPAVPASVLSSLLDRRA